MARFKKTDKIRALAGIPMFADLSKKDLGFLAGITTEVAYPAGTELVKQGELGREAMVIMRGSAVVRRDGRTIADLGEGEVVGEMSLINSAHRNATVVASTDVDVLIMDSREFSSMLSAHPSVSTTVLKTIAARLAENQQSV